MCLFVKGLFDLFVCYLAYFVFGWLVGGVCFWWFSDLIVVCVLLDCV